MDIVSFSDRLKQITSTPTYQNSDEETQQRIIRGEVDEFIRKNPSEADAAYDVAESRYKDFRRNTGQGRYIPAGSVEGPWSDPNFDYLNPEEKEEAIKGFRNQIDAMASADPINREDLSYYYNTVADAYERRIRGEDTGWVMDKAYRAWDGLAGFLADAVGASDVANSIRRYSKENPKYDEDLTAMLAEGIGSVGASMAVFIGGSLIGGAASGGNPVGATVGGVSASLAANATVRYNEAYRKAVELGLDESQAVDAGIAAMPAAAIDALSDKLMGAATWSRATSTALKSGSTADKIKAIQALAKDRTARGIMLRASRDAFAEGMSEAVGDYVAGYGAYAVTGEDEFIPGSGELGKSFIVGAILGGGISVGGAAPGVLRGEKATLDAAAQQLQEAQNQADQQQEITYNPETGASGSGGIANAMRMIASGRYREALDILKAESEAPATTDSTSDDPISLEVTSSENPQFATVIGAFLPSTQEQENAGINVNSVRPFDSIADTTPLPLISREEQEAVERLRTLPQTTRQQFEEEAVSQFNRVYANNLEELAEAISQVPRGRAGVSGIRYGVLENDEAFWNIPGAEFPIQEAHRVSNITIVPSGTDLSGEENVADFTVVERGDAEGSEELSVQPSPELITKIREAVLRGRGDDITVVLPVNADDKKWLKYNNVDSLKSVPLDGEKEVRKSRWSKTTYYRATENSANFIADELDKKYGVGNWVLKDSVSSDGRNTFFNRQDIIDRIRRSEEETEGNENAGVDPLYLNGLYAEPVNPALTGRPSNQDFRVHVIKRNGSLQVIPYATHNKSNAVPYIARTQSIAEIEQAAMEYAESIQEDVAENGLLSVDVVLGSTGEWIATGANPTQYGEASNYYNFGGSSGFARTPYVASSIYSYLKGRPPAWVFAGRAVLRRELQKKAREQGAPVVSSVLSRIYGDVQDQVQFRSEILKTYGEQVADASGRLWAAFKESAGEVTQKIIDLVRAILRSVSSYIPAQRVSQINSGIMQAVNRLANRNLNRVKQMENRESLDVPASSEDDRINVNSEDDARRALDEPAFTPVYREASAYQALPMIDPNSSADLSMQDVFFATSPELALGQGENRGVRMEFDRSRLNLQPNMQKPGTALAMETGAPIEMIGRNNTQEEYQAALMAVEFDPRDLRDASGRRLQMVLENSGWRRSESDGIVRYERPNIDSVDDVKRALDAIDEEYLNAVKSGDLIKAQQMVNRAAENAGYTPLELYHGSAYAFTSFDPERFGASTLSSHKAFFFTDDQEVALTYAASAAELLYMRRLDELEDLKDLALSNGNHDLVARYKKEIESFSGTSNRYDYVNDNLRLYKTFLRGNFFEVDAQGADYQELDRTTEFENISAILDYARENGYDGVIIKNFYDSFETGRKSNHYAVFNPNNIKSSEPVTYDEQGNVVPLSQRFNASDNRITHSLGPNRKSDVIAPLRINGNLIRNSSEALDFLESQGVENLNKLVGNNQLVREALSNIPVFDSKGNGSFYDGTHIRIDGTVRLEDQLRLLEHELFHAVTETALRINDNFRTEVSAIRSDVLSHIASGEEGTYQNKVAKILQYARSLDPNSTMDAAFFNNQSEITAYANSIKANPDMVRIAYALTSNSEFLSGLSDYAFRDLLKSVKAGSNKNLFQRIIDAIARFFTGSTQENTLEASERLIKGILDSNYKIQIKPINSIHALDPKRVKASLQNLVNLKKQNIADRFDINTSRLVNILKDFNLREINRLPEASRERVWDLIDNIYNSRSTNTKNPAARIDTSYLIEELEAYKRTIDSIFIQDEMKRLDGILDFSGFEKLDDREAFKEYVQSLQAEQGYQQQANLNRNAKRIAEYNKRMDAIRSKYSEIRDTIVEQYKDADGYVKSIEDNYGVPISSEKLKDFLKIHYDYLTQFADIASMEGDTLNAHFFAINNMLDGRWMNGKETTVEYIRKLRDSNINFESLADKFRDPVINHGRGILGQIDQFNKLTEISQVQLERWSRFIEGKDFLQNDLAAGFMESLLIDAENAQNKARNDYLTARDKILNGREMTPEDRITMSFASRLIQFNAGSDPNAAFLRNIANERKAFENIVGDPNSEDPKRRQGAGDPSFQREYREVVIPIFEKMVAGLEDSDQPMMDFMNNIEVRMGLGDPNLGAQRKAILQAMQDIQERFSLDNEIISELFYKKPFRRVVNYLPRAVVPINPTMNNNRDVTLENPIEDFENDKFQTSSMTAIPGQLMTRSAINNNSYYVNNIEHIFERGIRVAAITAHTTAERFILNARLRQDGPVANMINLSNSTYRTDQLKLWGVTLLRNAMQSGNPLGRPGEIMQEFGGAYARVALSGFHQGITQTVAGYVDYQIRTGNIIGAMQAANYYISNKTRMDQWFEENASRIANRSFLGERELDRRKSVELDENSIRNLPFVKRLSKIYDKAGDIITFSLRKGDDFSARSLILAEYHRLLQQKNPNIKTLNDVDWSTVEGDILTRAIGNIEQNINASNKVTRGEFFTDRSKGMMILRNVLFAFSQNVMQLAAQFNLAARDLWELHTLGGSDADKARAIRRMGAIISQTLAFSASRYIINGSLAYVMIGLIRDLFDDEDGKIAELALRVDQARMTGDDALVAQAEYELEGAIAIRKQIEKFSNSNLSFESFFKNTMRESLGTMHFVFNGPAIPQKIVFNVVDTLGESIVKANKEEQVSAIKDKIKDARKKRNFGLAAKLTEDLAIFEAQEWLPFEFDQIRNTGMGGIYGAALGGIYSSLDEFVRYGAGLTEININDFMLAAQAAGLGQADLNRMFRVIDRIEDDEFRRTKTFVEKSLPEARQREAEQKKRRDERELEKALREIFR